MEDSRREVDPGEPDAAAVSKNQRKKAARYAVRHERWAQKRVLKKEHRAAARELQRALAGAPAADEGRRARADAGAQAGVWAAAKASKKEDLARMLQAQAMDASLPSLAIDLSHSGLMLPAELSSMVQQLTFCYADNKRAAAPLPLHFTSFGGEMERALERVFAQGWHVQRQPQPYWQAFPREAIVVLSADAADVLRELEPGMVYVVGGFVDHNRHKGLVQRDAQARGLASARLPLAEYSTMATRHVLTVNQVVHMLLRFHASRSWPEAIVAAIPERKGLRLKRGADELEREGAPVSGDGGGGSADVAAAAAAPAALGGAEQGGGAAGGPGGPDALPADD